MIKRILKKTPIIIFGTFLISIPINNAYAYTFNVDFADTGGQTNSNSASSNKPYSHVLSTKNGTENGYEYQEKYTCKYKYSVTSTNSVTVNGYNISNQKIIEDSLKIKEQNKVLAGTSIGLEIYETKKISYSVGDISVEYTKEKTKKQESKCKSYTCEYSCTYKGAPKQTITKTVNAGYSCSNGNSKSTMHSCVNTHQTAKCTGYTNNWTETNEIINNTTYTNENNGYVKECLEYAVAIAKQKANTDTPATYSVKIPNSNDATASGTTTIQGKTVKTGRFNLNNNKTQKQATREVEYEYSTNTCMNFLTSKVRYVNDASECNKDNEIIIANDTVGGRIHWHYFVPLNAKSSEYSVIELTKNTTSSNNGQKSKNSCLYVLENNPIIAGNDDKTFYLDLIKRSDEKPFFSDYTEKCKSSTNKKTCSKDYKYFANGGTCYLTSTIKIPINQKFYQEKKDNDGNIIFSGFNFYYRPININDPFPNGFSEDSYWKEWDKEGRKEPNMANSYKVITYSAININTSIVRSYKNMITDGKPNTYSSWNNMSSSGKSNFISNQGVITRHNTGDYYKIGEGPSVTIKKGQAIMTGSDNS